MDELRCEIRFERDPDLDSPGKLAGVLMRYDEMAGDRSELFEKGSLTWPDTGVVLREQHDRKQPIMRVVPELVGDEIRISAQLPNTQRGRDAAVLVRNGTLRGLSVEFHSSKEKFVGGVRRIRAAALVGAGLVDDPSYRGSRVEVRGRRGRRRVWL